MIRKDIVESLAEYSLNEDQIAAMVSIAAIKASVYGNGEPSDEDFKSFFEWEILKCLKGFDPEDPETKEALDAGVPEENLRHFADVDRQKLIQQAEWIAFGLKKLKD